MNGAPFLSVCMITYGHEAFIKQAIESVLMQKTKFDFEVIIANDCSPDKTDSIIKDIINAHDKSRSVNYLSNSENIGMHANFLKALSKCKGKYIALCEGDDYWIDPLKLQKQVDFLEEHPDYEVCFTNIQIIHHDGEIVKEQLINDDRKSTYFQEDMPIWAPTLTRVFRNRDFSTLPDAPGLDAVMLIYQAKFGKVKFLDDLTGVYRLHDNSIYSSRSEVEKKEAVVLTLFKSLHIIDTKLLPKFFGKIFKKLLEVKVMDVSMFRKNRSIFFDYYKTYFKHFKFVEHLKFLAAFILISLPIKNKTYTNYLNKLFTLHYIYKV